jgi:hypothetical protein
VDSISQEETFFLRIFPKFLTIVVESYGYQDLSERWLAIFHMSYISLSCCEMLIDGDDFEDGESNGIEIITMGNIR